MHVKGNDALLLKKKIEIERSCAYSNSFANCDNKSGNPTIIRISKIFLEFSLFCIDFLYL